MENGSGGGGGREGDKEKMRGRTAVADKKRGSTIRGWGVVALVPNGKPPIARHIQAEWRGR